MKKIVIIFLACIVMFSFDAKEKEEPGTLIVSYQTGPQGERLDRVRFRLTDSKQEYRFFPQGTNFASDSTHPNRIVVVEDLSPGNYWIEFLIPNTDGLFEEIPKKTITIKAGERLQINQNIHPKYAALHISVTTRQGISPFVSIPTITLIDETKSIKNQSSSGELVLKNLNPGRYSVFFEDLSGYKAPAPISIQVKAGDELHPYIGVYECELDMPDSHLDEHSQKKHPCLTSLPAFFFGNSLYAKENAETGYGQILIRTNQPTGRWMIYRDDLQVYDGKGSENGIPVSPGTNYRLRVEELDGYKVTTVPASPFKVNAGQLVNVSIKYEKTFGTINLKASMPKGGFLKVSLESKIPGLKSLETRLDAKKGVLEWTSPSIPTGTYTMSFEPSPPYVRPPPQTIRVESNQSILVSPELILPKSLKVMTGFPQAVFTLKEEKGDRVLKGSGAEFLFNDLSPGTYILNFSSPLPEDRLPPPNQKIVIAAYQDSTVKVVYPKAGKLILQTNVQEGLLTLDSKENPSKSIRKEVHSGKQIIVLPEGVYTAGFEPVKGELRKAILSNSSITIQSGKIENLQLTMAKPEKSTPLPPAIISTPSSSSELVFLSVPSGESILGSIPSDTDGKNTPPLTVDLAAFSISAYETTNAQYAYWLNQALLKGKITYHSEGEQKGTIVDAEGHVLCKTKQASQGSQISADIDTAKSVKFIAVPNKTNHPVVEVSWYGASAYCEDNNCRLATEAEWEKAAGMDVKIIFPPLKKYRYGFSRNTIDRTWANYADDRANTVYGHTTEVGFYNGVNILPANENTSPIQVTHRAVSPVGAYDMSGNVWEWVSDWYDTSYPMDFSNPKGPSKGTQKVVKGGSYASSSMDVRVSERKGLSPDYTDAMTGFRVAR